MFGRRSSSGYAICPVPSVGSFLRRVDDHFLTGFLPFLCGQLFLDVPLAELVANPAKVMRDETPDEMATYVVCRLGNDSQLAVETLRNAGMTGIVKDLVGGLRAWAKEVDQDFPVY